MERLKKAKRLGGGLKDRPLCELCGKPVEVKSDDIDCDEILCTSCTSEIKVSKYDEYDCEI